MTKEEALRILDTIPTKGDEVDALEMAIEALEQKVDVSTNTPTKTDYISRQAAIDALEEYLDRLQIVNWQENPGVPYKVHGLNWAVNTIRELPSAQPEIVRCKDCKHHWIHRCMDSVPKEICELDQLFYDANVDFCSLAERRE